MGLTSPRLLIGAHARYSEKGRQQHEHRGSPFSEVLTVHSIETERSDGRNMVSRRTCGRHTHMRRTLTMTALTLVVGGAAHAQDVTSRGEGVTNFAATATVASGAASGQFGLHVAGHVVLFGETGRLRTLETPTSQPGLDQTFAAIEADRPSPDRVQTGYSIGGVKVELPGNTMFTPYVFSGVGAARLAPPTQFTYEGGPTLGEAIGVAGSQTTTVLVVRVGGGVQIPVGRHLVGDLGYTVSRVSSTQVVDAHGMTFGLSVTF